MTWRNIFSTCYQWLRYSYNQTVIKILCTRLSGFIRLSSIISIINYKIIHVWIGTFACQRQAYLYIDMGWPIENAGASVNWNPFKSLNRRKNRMMKWEWKRNTKREYIDIERRRLNSKNLWEKKKAKEVK